MAMGKKQKQPPAVPEEKLERVFAQPIPRATPEEITALALDILNNRVFCSYVIEERQGLHRPEVVPVPRLRKIKCCKRVQAAYEAMLTRNRQAANQRVPDTLRLVTTLV